MCVGMLGARASKMVMGETKKAGAYWSSSPSPVVPFPVSPRRLVLLRNVHRRISRTLSEIQSANHLIIAAALTGSQQGRTAAPRTRMVSCYSSAPTPTTETNTTTATATKVQATNATFYQPQTILMFTRTTSTSYAKA